MGFRIEGGTGSGYYAGVTRKNQLKTFTENAPLQFLTSYREEQAYQVVGDFATLNNATHAILHVKNDDPNRIMVVTYIRMQATNLSGGGTLPDAANYFQVGFGRTVSSGGTAVTPVNQNRRSGNTALVTATDNNPTMAGTFVENDRRYFQADGDAVTWNKEGSIIVGLNDTIECRIVTDQTAGTGYARISFLMINPEDIA